MSRLKNLSTTSKRRLLLTSVAAMVACSPLLLRPSLALSPTFTSLPGMATSGGSSRGQPSFIVGPAVACVEPLQVRGATGRQLSRPAGQLTKRSFAFPPLFANENSDDERQNDDDKPKKRNKKGATPTNSKYDPNIDYDNIELEFVDYADPNYAVDQGVVEGEEAYATAEPTDEDLIEEMREDRRRRNDEFQFQTYFRDAWHSGSSEFRGVWTTYGTTTFIDDMDGPKNGEAPGILRARVEPRVISSATKAMVNPDAEWRGDREVILHEEYEVTNEAAEPTLSRLRDTDTDSGFGRDDDDDVEGDGGAGASTRTRLESRYWPTEMRSRDFRGPQGNMCVGNAYTVCDAIKLYEDGRGGGDDDDDHEGPFSELRAELGVHGEDMRMRVKFEYLVKPDDDEESSSGEPSKTTTTPPPLHLSTVTVCRERRDEWPVPSRDVALFSTANVGARGGLYDPPPCGGDEQSARYMALDLEGGATVLFPHSIDQRPDAFDGNGWVFSLDWTPGTIRYQVDRKFGGGAGLKGLKTLELSEVEALEADTYRPKDGPADMRQ